MKTFLTFIWVLCLIVAGGFVATAWWSHVDRRIAVIDAQAMQISIDVRDLAADVRSLSVKVRRLHESTAAALQESTADLKADLGELRSGQNVVIRTQQEDRAAQWKQYERQNKVMRHFHHHHPSQGEFK